MGIVTYLPCRLKRSSYPDFLQLRNMSGNKTSNLRLLAILVLRYSRMSDGKEWATDKGILFILFPVASVSALPIFHNISIDRRNSLDDLESLQRREAPKPHPARLHTLAPLSQKQECEENESERTQWYSPILRSRGHVTLGTASGN